MSLSRAFSRRAAPLQEDNKKPLLTKASLRSLDRSKISAPILLNTTNVNSFSFPSVETAQKLRKMSSISSRSSKNSDMRSDNSSIGQRSRSTSMTDKSSIDLCCSPKSIDFPKHVISKQLQLHPRKAASIADLKAKSPTLNNQPPMPQRAATNAKVLRERVVRKHSLQHMRKPEDYTSEPLTSSPRSNRALRASKDMFSMQTYEQQQHPFSKEFAQLDEVVEEFGGVPNDPKIEADHAVMRRRGLVKITAEDYLFEVEHLFSRHFPPNSAGIRPTEHQGSANNWI